MESVPYLGGNLRRWRMGPSTFLALPERGARLVNWNLTLGDGSVRDVIHWPEVASLDDLARVRGGNPILFPFCGRSFDQDEIGWWRAADGVRRPMPMHGLARQGAFRLTRCDAGGFTALFLPDEAALAAYPFDYEFEVSYRFEPRGFAVELVLRNLGRVALPWSAGHHFYFTLPWTEGRTRADYAIRIPATEAWRQDKTGRLQPAPALAAGTLDDPAFVDLIQTGLREPIVTVADPAGERLRLRIGTGRTPPEGATVVTWSESAEAPYYCVEPWMGPPNAPGHRRGLHHVEPSGVQKFAVEVQIEG